MNQKNNSKAPFRNLPKTAQNENDNTILSNKTNSIYETKLLSQYGNITDFLRSSSDRIPDTHYLIKNSGVPFGIHFTPFANGMNDLQSISIGNEKISCCSKCGTFVNKYCKINTESNWECNTCSNMNKQLTSSDKLVKEHDVVEFFANSDYIERPPIEPSFVFIIDVSKKSIESGFLSVIIDTLRYIFTNKTFQDEERTNVAFITFDNNINFFEINKKTKNIQMLSINGDEAFLPQKDNSLLIPFDEYRSQLITFIDSFESIYSVNRITNETVKESTKVLNAIETGKLLLQKVGGKLIVMNSSSDWLKSLNNSQPDSQSTNQLKSLGQQLAKHQICIDIFQTQLGKEAQNLTSLNTISNYANGYFYLYNSFRLEIHYKSLFNQILRSITKSLCSEILMTITHSSEVLISKSLTPLAIQINNQILLPQIDNFNSYSFIFDYVQITPNAKFIPLKKSCIYFQFSIIYTHNDCSRRIRVFNLKVDKSISLDEYYKYIDIEASTVLIAKMFINQLSSGIKIENSLAEINQLYFNYALSGLKESQYKELLHQFLLCFLGLMKNRICCKDIERNKINPDLIAYTRNKILKAKVDEVMTLILPKIYNITSIIQGNNTFENIALNPSPCDSSSIKPDQVYLIDNGQFLILHITEGDNNNQLIQLFFGDEMTFDIVGTYFHSEQSVFDDNANKTHETVQKTESTINLLREKKCYYQELFFSFEGCLSENMVKDCLVQTSVCPWFNYSFSQYLKKI